MMNLFCRVRFERAFAKEFNVEVSTEVENWTPETASWKLLFNRKDGREGWMEFPITPAIKIRALKLTEVKAAVEGWGMSIWELEVMGRKPLDEVNDDNKNNKNNNNATPTNSNSDNNSDSHSNSNNSNADNSRTTTPPSASRTITTSTQPASNTDNNTNPNTNPTNTTDENTSNNDRATTPANDYRPSSTR